MPKDRFLLRMEGISKEFPGVKALDNVCFELRSGEVHALLGENGAGKTTLMNVLNGVVLPDSGRIYLDGEEKFVASPQVAQALGIAFIHQELNLIDELTVMENFFVGQELITRRRLIDWREMYRRSKQLLDSLKVDVDPLETVGTLPVSKKQMVEIAKALAFEAKIIVMDEPTSSLTDEETRTLFELIRDLKSKGKGIIYISHRMEEIFEITDRITVLRNGRYVGTKLTAETNYDELVRMMIGEDPGKHFYKGASTAGDVMLEVKALYGPKLVRDVSFQVRAGEILGVAGLMGSGRTELLETIFGYYQPRSGQILLEGKPFRPRSPRTSLKKGIAYVPEDREGKGLFLDFSVSRNIQLAKIERDSLYGLVRSKETDQAVLHLVERMGIVTPSVFQAIRNLSGGNRQKTILARWVHAGMKVLLINEPTRGIDIGAKTEMYKLLKGLNEKGVAIVMVSSELPEVLSVSDRILVMHEGRVSAIFDSGTVGRKEVLKAMTGLSRSSA